MGRAPQTGLALVSRDVFNRLAKYQPLHECWIDFTLWAACQAGEQDIHQRALQGQLLARYPSGTKQLFLAVFRELQAVIAANPRQNAMLQIMIALGLDDRDTYMGAEVSAENTLLERMQAQAGPGVSVQALDHLTVKDTDCAVNNGSSMIALANIVSRVFPQNPQEKILFALPEASDGFSQFMAFVQPSLMGFSAYTAPSRFAVWDINGDATFAPKNAICSPGFFSDYWNDARLKSILDANGIK